MLLSALYPFLFLFFSILHKLFRSRSFKGKVFPQSLYLLVFPQHSPQSSTMRLLLPDCCPLPILHKCSSFRHQIFVATLLTQIGRVGLLHIIDNYRSKLPETEGFVTAAIITPQHGPLRDADRAWHEAYFFCFVPATAHISKQVVTRPCTDSLLGFPGNALDVNTIFHKIITVLTRYRPIVLELI